MTPPEELTEAEFERVRVLLETAAGLTTDGSRRAALTCVIKELRAESGCLTTDDYLRLATADPTECQRLVEASVVGETQWLRTPPQMQALRATILPRLLAARGDRPVRIWSAGCASGEEVWTLAMLALEAGARRGEVEVLGTDVSGRAVEAAISGRYAERSLQRVDTQRRMRFLDQVEQDPPMWEVRESLRSMVEVRRHDLVHDALPYPSGGVDLILCRNVMIYFSRETTRLVVERLLDALAPDGTLLLGHSETLWQVTDKAAVERIGDAFTYRHAPGVANVMTAASTIAGSGAVGGRPAARLSWRRPLPPSVGSPAAVTSLPSGLPAVPAALGDSGDSVASGGFRSSGGSGASVGSVAAGVRAALQACDYDGAVAMATASVRRDPLDPAGHYLLGLVLATLDRHEEAIAALRKATYADPGSGLAHFLLATSLACAGHAAASRVSYAAAAQALRDKPASAIGAPELGGRSVDELAELCESLSVDPSTRRVSS